METEKEKEIKNKNKKGKKVPTMVIFIIFLTGLVLLLYPTLSDFYNKFNNYQTIKSYEEEINNNVKVQHQQMFENAINYNNSLNGYVVDISNDSQRLESYNNSLDFGNGMIGYIQISKINVLLPIYHGVSEKVLTRGIGHMEGSYLPTGEIGNHTVLTGHTGLPSATLLSDADQLEIGDIFTLTVLDRNFYYEIKEIKVVEPEQVTIEVDKNKDLVSLITCTPYGINTHRLVILGEQVELSVEYVKDEFVQQQKQMYSLMQGGLFGIIIGVLLGILIGCGFTILVNRLFNKDE